MITVPLFKIICYSLISSQAIKKDPQSAGNTSRVC
nr:MAG TPA: hypothetical protein [Caudoviricetes sp.]